MVWQPVHSFRRHWNIQSATGWIAMKFGAEVHGFQTMPSTDFCDPLTVFLCRIFWCWQWWFLDSSSRISFFNWNVLRTIGWTVIRICEVFMVQTRGQIKQTSNLLSSRSNLKLGFDHFLKTTLCLHIQPHKALTIPLTHLFSNNLELKGRVWRGFRARFEEVTEKFPMFINLLLSTP